MGILQKILGRKPLEEISKEFSAEANRENDDSLKLLSQVNLKDVSVKGIAEGCFMAGTQIQALMMLEAIGGTNPDYKATLQKLDAIKKDSKEDSIKRLKGEIN